MPTCCARVQSEDQEADLVSRMKSILMPFVMRRLKADVADQLPPKIQEVGSCLCEPHLLTAAMRSASSRQASGGGWLRWQVRVVAMEAAQAQLYQHSVCQLRREVAERRAAHAGEPAGKQQGGLANTHARASACEQCL